MPLREPTIACPPQAPSMPFRPSVTPNVATGQPFAVHLSPVTTPSDVTTPFE